MGYPWRCPTCGALNTFPRDTCSVCEPQPAVSPQPVSRCKHLAYEYRCTGVLGHEEDGSAHTLLEPADLRECQHDPPCCAEHCNACNLQRLDAVRDTMREAMARMRGVEGASVAGDVNLRLAEKLLYDALRRLWR